MTKDEKTQEKRDRKRYETFKLKWMAEEQASFKSCITAMFL